MKTVKKRETVARISHLDDVVLVWIPYNRALIAEIKALPQRVYTPALKCWHVPVRYEVQLREIVERYYKIVG